VHPCQTFKHTELLPAEVRLLLSSIPPGSRAQPSSTWLIPQALAQRSEAAVPCPSETDATSAATCQKHAEAAAFHSVAPRLAEYDSPEQSQGTPGRSGIARHASHVYDTAFPRHCSLV